MKVNLTNKDLITLISGVQPNLEFQQYLKDFGYYDSEMNFWIWNKYYCDCWDNIEDNELFEMYKKISKK